MKLVRLGEVKEPGNDLGVLFRYHDERVYGWHDDRVFIRLVEYPIIKETPCGFWIKIAWNKKKWVSKNGYSSFAKQTEPDAFESFLRRKQRQVSIIKNNLKFAKLALEEAYRMQSERE